MAKKTRICKICGKEYEYCNHCPSKNLIEPWRNLYCSENCRDAFVLFGDYVAKKKSAVEVKEKLQSWGLIPSKVRELHKPVVSEIFKNGTPSKVEESPIVVEVESAPSSVEIKSESDKKDDVPFYKKNRKKNKNIVNEED